MKTLQKYIPLGLLLFFIFLANSAQAADPFTSGVFGGSCSSYECWIAKVWNWALVIMIPLSAIVLAWAGLIYTTSEGNPQRIGIAKKYIIGVISGVALLILARLFLVGFLGMPSTGAVWNV